MNCIKITETAKLHLYTVNFDQGSTQRFSITWLLCSLSFFFHLTYGFRLLIWYLLTLPLKLTFFELNLIIGLDLTVNFFFPLSIDMFFPLQSTGHFTMLKAICGIFLSFQITWIQLCCVGVHVAHLFSPMLSFFWIVNFSLLLRFTFSLFTICK